MNDEALLSATGTPERRPSLVETAYEAMKQAIRDGVFPPGYQRSEQEIAHRLQMSRTPVHEAIIRLQAEGMVQLLSKRGVVIKALSPLDMKEIYNVVIAIEGMAALLLAERDIEVREHFCRKLAALNEEMSRALEADDLVEWARLDSGFHELLVEGCDDGRLARIARIHLDQSHRARRVTLHLRPRPVQSIVEHQALIDAIRAGDGALAQQCAQAHKRRARDLIIDLLHRYEIRYL